MATLTPKKVKGRITILMAIPYKDCMVYIRMINSDIFMYDAIFKKQLYSSYMIFTPRNGQTKLNQNEIRSAVALIFAGAKSTIDMLLGQEVKGRQREVAKEVEKLGRSVN